MHHSSSGAIVAFLPLGLHVWLIQLDMHPLCSASVDTEQNSNGCHGAMFFNIYQNYPPTRNLINPENPEATLSPKAAGRPDHGHEPAMRTTRWQTLCTCCLVGVAYAALAIDANQVLRLWFFDLASYRCPAVATFFVVFPGCYLWMACVVWHTSCRLFTMELCRCPNAFHCFLGFVGFVLLVFLFVCLVSVFAAVFWFVTFSGSSAWHRSDYLVTLLGCEALTCVTASSA